MNSPWDCPEVAQLFQDCWISNKSFSNSAIERMRVKDSIPSGSFSKFEPEQVDNFFDRHIFLQNHPDSEDVTFNDLAHIWVAKCHIVACYSKEPFVNPSGAMDVVVEAGRSWEHFMFDAHTSWFIGDTPALEFEGRPSVLGTFGRGRCISPGNVFGPKKQLYRIRSHIPSSWIDMWSSKMTWNNFRNLRARGEFYALTRDRQTHTFIM
jgi:hypothetical protein